VKKNRLSRQDTQKRCHLQVWDEKEEKYIDILYKHQGTLSVEKYNLKLQDQVYWKQFKIPEAQHQFIKQKWLKLGILKRARANSLYNSPIFLQTGPRTLDCTRLLIIEQEFPHQQIHNEQNHCMYLKKVICCQ
jgi:hypothetical protein